MPIKINGITGSVTLAAPGGSDVTLTLPTDSIQPGLVLVASQSFSGVSTVSVNNCFTSTYENYRILLTNTTYTGTGAISTYIRLRAAGSDNAASNYRWGRSFGGATSGGSTSWSDTSFFFAGTSAVVNHQGSVDMYAPQIAAPTAYTATTFMEESATSGLWSGGAGGRMTVSSQFDGFTFFLSGSATFSGTIRVYGYR